MLQVIFAVVLVISSFAGGIYFHKKGNARNLKELAYYQSTFLRKQGFTVFVEEAKNGYNLRSFDGGKTWYAAEQLADGSLKILGLSDVVYPGLLQHLHGMDALKNHVKKFGPLTFSGERTTEDRKIAEAAGFTVERK